MVLALLTNVQASCLLKSQSKGHCQHAKTPVDGLRSRPVKGLELAKGSIFAKVCTGFSNFGAHIDTADMGVGVGVVQLLLSGLVTDSRTPTTLQWDG
jgi:hypothetical protein